MAPPAGRYVSNRIFNDVGQNLFSENGVSQWGWAWGQFLDHDFGLRDETPGGDRAAAVRPGRSARGFTNDLGGSASAARRPRPAPGATTPRQQVNTLSSLHRRVERLRRRRGARRAWLARRRELAAAARRLPAARRRPRQRGNGARDGPLRPRSSARPAARSSPATSRANENIASDRRSRRCSPASTTASSRLLPASLSAEQQVPDRAARGRRGDPVHHLPRVPPGARRQARRRTRGYKPTVDADLVERVRDGRLPGAHDGARRDRAVRARGHLDARRSSPRSRRAGIVVEHDDGDA